MIELEHQEESSGPRWAWRGALAGQPSLHWLHPVALRGGAEFTYSRCYHAAQRYEVPAGLRFVCYASAGCDLRYYGILAAPADGPPVTLELLEWLRWSAEVR